jgi:hypothetical protein
VTKEIQEIAKMRIGLCRNVSRLDQLEYQKTSGAIKSQEHLLNRKKEAELRKALEEAETSFESKQHR